MRLIDADALMTWFNDHYDFEEFSVGYISGIINEQPTIEPQRMKGKWMHDGYDHPHGVDWMHCSVCGRREPHVPAAMTNYCPSCGADMRGDEE